MKSANKSILKVFGIFTVLMLMGAFSFSAKANWPVEQIRLAEKVAIREFQKKMNSSRKMGFNVVSLSENKIVFSVQSKLAGTVRGQSCGFMIGVQRDQDQRLLAADLRDPKGRLGVKVRWLDSTTSLIPGSPFLRACPN